MSGDTPRFTSLEDLASWELRGVTFFGDNLGDRLGLIATTDFLGDRLGLTSTRGFGIVHPPGNVPFPSIDET